MPGELGILPLERLEVGLAALHAFLEGAIQVADHLPRSLQLLGRQVLEGVAHVLEVGTEDLLLQLLQELLVHLGRFRLDELVVLERAHRAAKIIWELIQLRYALGGELLHGRPELLVGRGCFAPPIEALSLEPFHFFQLLFELVERLGEIVALRAPLLGHPQPLEEVFQALHATGDAPASESRHGILEIAAREKLVGHRAKQLVGLECVEALRSVPARIANVTELPRESRRLVAARLLRVWLVHALNVERVSPRSLFSLRLRWRPSRTNSTAAAMAAGLPVAPSFATAPFIPGIWSACFTYS